MVLLCLTGLRWQAAAGGASLRLRAPSKRTFYCCGCLCSRRAGAATSWTTTETHIADPRVRSANPQLIRMLASHAGGGSAEKHHHQQQADVLHEVVLGRRTAGRMFDGRPVPEDVLLRAVEAAT